MQLKVKTESGCDNIVKLYHILKECLYYTVVLFASFIHLSKTITLLYILKILLKRRLCKVKDFNNILNPLILIL